MLGVSAGELRGYVRAGFLSPERGERGELRFSFQDLVFLRTTRGLTEARLPPHRIHRALTRLRQQIPEDRPLTAVRIGVDGSRIVAEDGARRWQPESGQILLDFGEALPESSASRIRPAPAPETDTPFSADRWFEWACELEADAPDDAVAAYRRALVEDPAHADAHVNLGRLLHEAGDAEAAAEHYEAALSARPEDAVAAFNLGVALEDLRKLPEALLQYQKAARLDPENADAHFNAAALAEKLGRSAEALQHLSRYRKLTRT